MHPPPRRPDGVDARLTAQPFRAADSASMSLVRGGQFSGELQDLETRLEGIDAAPGAISRMFAGENTGKMLITLS